MGSWSNKDSLAFEVAKDQTGSDDDGKLCVVRPESRAVADSNNFWRYTTKGCQKETQ